MDNEYEVAVDFMDMTDEGRLWARVADARPGTDMTVGRRVVVGDDDSEAKVAEILNIDDDGNCELQVLPRAAS